MQAIYKNEISGRSLDHNEKVCVIRLRVLPTTPFVKALVCWATGKRLTNHLPKLSLITVAQEAPSYGALQYSRLHINVLLRVFNTMPKGKSTINTVYPVPGTMVQ